MRRVVCTAGLFALLGWSSLVHAQDPPAAQDEEPVQLGTQLVTVPFNVTDKKNRLITDIQQSQLEVLEDGKPQEIFSFERESNAALTICLLIDTSGSQQETIGAERAAAYRFFEKVLQPGRDLAAVLTFAHRVTVEQELTSNLPALSRALDRARVVPSAAYSGAGSPPLNPKAGGTSLWDAVYLAADDVLRREAGRRVIVVITDGFDTTSTYNLQAAIERAWRSEVIVYCIGIGVATSPGGLEKLAKETGGRYFEPRGQADLDEAFAAIQEDLRQVFSLAYSPANTAKDGTFRRIEVRLRERKDLRVRHRRGYYAK